MHEFIRKIGVLGIENFGEVDLRIYRGAQPTEEGFQALKGMGVKTIICLRTFVDNRELAEKMGFQYFSFPMTVLFPASLEVIQTITDIMDDPANQPVFVHCLQGQDRTGLICGAYRIRHGWTLEDAEEEMASYIPSPLGELWWPIQNRLKEVV